MSPLFSDQSKARRAEKKCLETAPTPTPPPPPLISRSASYAGHNGIYLFYTEKKTILPGNAGLLIIFFNLGFRFTKNHKVSQTKSEELRSKKVSVEAQASYSGAFSVGGGFSMDKEQRSAASNFQKSVQTSTITVGAAPPSNGDALTWASSVQENPVPITYSLSATHNLFTERYSKHLPGINIDAVREKLINASTNYCQALKTRDW